MTDRAAARPKILVVDDEPDLVELLQALLSLADYDILTATDGEQALAAIRSHAPDGVVLDINMPKLDGFGVLERLAAEPPAKPPRILVLTARLAVDDVERALRLGARDYLAKPFSNKALLSRVLRLVQPSAEPQAAR